MLYGCVNLSRSCCVCAPCLNCRWPAVTVLQWNTTVPMENTQTPFCKMHKSFPYIHLVSPTPLFLALVRVWGFSSPSLECGGDLWMLLQQRHLLRWIFPSLCFSKRGGLCQRPQLRHFFLSVLEFSMHLQSGKYWELRVRLRVWQLSHIAPAWRRLGLIQVQSGGGSGMAHTQRYHVKMESPSFPEHTIKIVAN